MENAERPERLVIYGGIGKCARNWESYHAIVDALLNLENDETLAIQSGMPVAIFKTHRLAPRVVMATTNIMKATWPIFYDLQDKNLTMFAQYTAAPWEYIGTQGVIQGTFETLGSDWRAAFRRLAGRPDPFYCRTRRYGREPTSRHDDARRRLPRGGCKPGHHPYPHPEEIPGRGGEHAGGGYRARRAGQGRGPGAGYRSSWQCSKPLPTCARIGLEAGHRHRDVPVSRPDLLYRGRPHRGVRGGHAPRRSPGLS